MAKAALEHFRKVGADVDFIDLVDWPLPLCDAGSCYGDEKAAALKKKLMAAHGYLVASPVYNFDVNAALKNVIELTGRDVWTEKVVGFACAAGGHSSYMSVMAVANSLMLDFRTVIVPRFVYATGADFEDDRIANPDLAERVERLANDILRYTTGLIRTGG